MDLQQTRPSDPTTTVNDSGTTTELLMHGVDESTEDESNKSEPGSDDDKMEQFSQQNQLHRPHRDPIPDGQPSANEKKPTVVDAATVRKHVKTTLMKKQKSQHRQRPPPSGGNRKIRKQRSKRKQIPDLF